MKPFAGKKVYLCGAIMGLKDRDHHHFISKTAHYLIEQGADLLDEHIKADATEEMIEIIFQRTGVRRDQVPKPWLTTYEQDMSWIDEADFVIAFVDGPSLGVGVEIARTSLKKELGLNPTPLLLLVHQDNLDRLSLVVRGMASALEQVELVTYQQFADIQKIITRFLAKPPLTET